MSEECKFVPYEMAQRIVGNIVEEEHLKEANRRIFTVYDKQGRELCWFDWAQTIAEAKAAVDEHARLQKQVFPDLRLGLLHGRMKADEKDAVMTAFRDGEVQVIVSTSVVEVGVDVPNATVMIVEDADRFGLAQLHQLRGRVGRKDRESTCYLLYHSENLDSDGKKRLLTIVNNSEL